MAEVQRKKDPIYASPKGVAKYPHLTKPQTKFKPEGEYSVNLLLDPNDAATIEFVEKIQQAHDAALAAEKKANPKKKYNDQGIVNMVKDDTNKDGEPTGKTAIVFKAKASGTRKDKSVWNFRPALRDAKGNPLPLDTPIYGGSVVKVAFSFRHTAMPTGAFYTSLSLQAVQGISIVSEYVKDASAYGFGDESGEENQTAFGEEAGSEEAAAGASSDF